MRRSQIPHKSSTSFSSEEESKKRAGHSTRRTLIDVTSWLMDQKPLLQITSDQVLHASGVSKGSMYHFFNDFDELLEITQAERFNHWANALIQYVSSEFEKAHDRESFTHALERVMSNNCCETLKISHSELSRTLGFALGNTRFSRNIIEIKERVKFSILNILSESIERSLPGTSSMKAEGLALFIDTWIFGRIAGEFYRIPVKDTEWKELTSTLVNCMIPDAA
jgi:AcrR family transcriptional regulator